MGENCNVKERVLIEDSIICEDVELGDDVKIIRCYISKKSNGEEIGSINLSEVKYWSSNIKISF